LLVERGQQRLEVFELGGGQRADVDAFAVQQPELEQESTAEISDMGNGCVQPPLHGCLAGAGGPYSGARRPALAGFDAERFDQVAPFQLGEGPID
jgi:hypothetical protein